MIVEDNLNSDSIHFKLTEDINLCSSSSTQELYLSYGLKNPYRFLIIFGFFDPTMPEIFCESLFSNPPKKMIDLVSNCNSTSFQNCSLARNWCSSVYCIKIDRDEYKKTTEATTRATASSFCPIAIQHHSNIVPWQILAEDKGQC